MALVDETDSADGLRNTGQIGQAQVTMERPRIAAAQGLVQTGPQVFIGLLAAALTQAQAPQAQLGAPQHRGLA